MTEGKFAPIERELAKVLGLTGFIESLIMIQEAGGEMDRVDLVVSKHNKAGIASESCITKVRNAFNKYSLVVEIVVDPSPNRGGNKIVMQMTKKGDRLTTQIRKALEKLSS